MNDDELTALLRATLREQADHAPSSEGLADRMLARIEGLEADGTSPVEADVVELRPRRPHRNRWEGGRITAVLAAVASVAAVVTLSIVVAKHNNGSNTSATAGKQAAQYSAGGGQNAAAPSATIAAGSTADLTAAAPSAAAAPVPTTFTVTDLTYYTPGAGYALGTSACATDSNGTTKSASGTSSGGSTACATLARTSGTTSDLTWSLANASLPFAVGTTGAESVDHLRFATTAAGYAYGAGGVYATVDAGASWTRQLTSADALEVANGVVVAVNHPTSCGSGQACTYTVRVADTATDDWSAVTLPGGALVGTGVELARTGNNVYLVGRTATGADERFFASADGGRTWVQRSTDLCPTEKNGSQSSATALASAADGPTAVSVVCSSSAGTFLHTSVNAGTTFVTGKVNLTGVKAMVMMSATGTLFSSDQLYRSVNTGNSYTAAATGPNSIVGTPRFLGFENATVGRWVSPDGSTVWTTTDGGAQWTLHSFR